MISQWRSQEFSMGGVWAGGNPQAPTTIGGKGGETHSRQSLEVWEQSLQPPERWAIFAIFQ